MLPVLATVVGFVIVLSPGATENAIANGDTRTIHLHHAHTQESIDATYMVDGQYDPAVLQKLNWFLRDWRREEATHMDPRLFDVIWEVYRESGSQKPIEVMSAYRSPQTNAMLRRASRAVAEHSQHILGKAMDQHYVDVPMSRIREIAMRLQRGGVGFYPTAGSPFVHMDVGGVRHWPRMSYDQLSRLFPDGKTVHIPSNGQPLPHYEEARAELEARGDSFNYPTAGEVQSKSKGFFAWLFGGGGDEGDDAESAGGRAAPSPRRAVASLDRTPVGATDSAPLASNSKDAGMHGFAFGDAQPAPSSPAPAPAPAAAPSRRGRRTQLAALPQSAPPSAEAQRKLAAEMQRQQQDEVAADAQRKAAAEMQARADAEASAASAAAPTAFDPTGAQPTAPVETLPVGKAEAPPVLRAAAPLPPRRPVELAAAGPAAPLPPSRPDEFAGRTDHAPTPRAAVATLSPLPPSVRAGLPAAITGGAVPRALAFAAGSDLPARSDVPLPVARPQLVAARLDRSNFRSLMGAGFGKNPARTGLGSAMSALRPAARASLGVIVAEPSSGSARGFGVRATDLTTDRFSGMAVKPADRISTAVLRKPRTATESD